MMPSRSPTSERTRYLCNQTNNFQAQNTSCQNLQAILELPCRMTALMVEVLAMTTTTEEGTSTSSYVVSGPLIQHEVIKRRHSYVISAILDQDYEALYNFLGRKL